MLKAWCLHQACRSCLDLHCMYLSLMAKQSCSFMILLFHVGAEGQVAGWSSCFQGVEFGRFPLPSVEPEDRSVCLWPADFTASKYLQHAAELSTKLRWVHNTLLFERCWSYKPCRLHHPWVVCWLLQDCWSVTHSPDWLLSASFWMTHWRLPQSCQCVVPLPTCMSSGRFPWTCRQDNLSTVSAGEVQLPNLGLTATVSSHGHCHNLSAFITRLWSL